MNFQLYGAKFIVSIFVVSILVCEALGQCNVVQTKSVRLIQEDTNSGAVSWLNANDADSSDNSWAYVTAPILGSISHTLMAKDFGFNIPEASTVCGVEVHIERHASGVLQNVKDDFIQLILQDTVQGDDLASASRWPTSEGTANYGNSSELWGLTLNPIDINQSNFGVAVSVNLSGVSVLPTARIDHIQMSVHYSGVVLPVELTDFSARVVGQNAILTWETATESSNDYFTIESSIDGVEWIVESIIPGAINSRSSRVYSANFEMYEDTYFRLRQTDLNGKSHALPPVLLKLISQESQKFIQSSNPTFGLLEIAGFGPGQLTVLNCQGFVVHREWLEADKDSERIDVSHFPTGVYFVHLESQLGKAAIEKIIKY
jgi:hypothetical protein